MLFQFDASELPARQVVRLYTDCFGEGPLPDDFAINLFLGIAKRIDAVDGVITSSSDNWRIDRMSRVDRNILRMGVHEILGSEETGTPPRVAINEAVELAKRFGTAESASFVNGILDRVARDKLKL
jgi:N utilization substance protein B